MTRTHYSDNTDDGDLFLCAYPRDDQYCNKLYDALEDYRIFAIEGEYSFRWFFNNRHKFKALHFHWPSFYYGGHKHQAIGLFKFVLFMIFVRLFNKNIFWTAHNLYPHNVIRVNILDYMARLFVIIFSKLVFVHGTGSEHTLGKEFPLLRFTRTCVIDHGNYIGHMPNTTTFEESRRKLGISTSAYVYLSLGRARPYKGIEDLIDAFAISSEGDDVLLLVGRYPDKEYLKKIKNKILEKENVRDKIILVDERVDDEDVQIYMNASNVIVLPYKYRSVLTSGIALVSLSFGLPVIAPRIGYFNDLINDDNMGLLYDQGISLRELAQILVKAKGIQVDRSKTIKKIEKYSWQYIAEQTYGCLKKTLNM